MRTRVRYSRRWIHATPPLRSRRRSGATTTPGTRRTSTTIVTFHAPGMVFENHTAGDRVEGDAVGAAHRRDLRAEPRPALHRAQAVCAGRARRQRVDCDGDEPRRAAGRVGRDRRVPLRERPDPAQGRLLVLARSARPRRLAPCRGRAFTRRAGVPAEIDAGARRAFELVEAPRAARRRVVTPAVPVDAAFLDAAGPQLRIVANYAVGLDNIDLDGDSRARDRRHATRRAC